MIRFSLSLHAPHIPAGAAVRLLVAIAGLVPLRPVLAQPAGYTVIELSNAPDAGQVTLGLNNLGDVVGRTSDSVPAKTRATVWNRGRLKKKHFSTLLGDEYSSAFCINDVGEAAGASNSDKSIVPLVWTLQGGVQRVPMLRGDNGGQAFGINKNGDVVGYSSGARGTRAFLWTRRSGVRDLGVLSGGDGSRARDVNDSGEVVGTSASAAGDRAVLWTTTGNLRDLGALPGDTSSEATAINNAGDVVGYSNGPQGMRAFLWTKANGMEDLGVLPGGGSSRALDINDAGCIVGSSTSVFGDRAFKWTRQTGIEDLNDSVPRDWQLLFLEAHAINKKGQILARGSAGNVGTMDGKTLNMIDGMTGAGPEHACAPAPESAFLLAPVPIN